MEGGKSAILCCLKRKVKLTTCRCSPPGMWGALKKKKVERLKVMYSGQLNKKKTMVGGSLGGWEEEGISQLVIPQGGRFVNEKESEVDNMQMPPLGCGAH